MDTSKWTQEIEVVKSSSMAEIAQNNTCSRPGTERKIRPQKDQAVNCPRCNSTNTKFCYYNNYSLTQPRYICKTCRRYWTAGGTLRNVPVGGGSRKNKKSSSSLSSSSSTANSTAVMTQNFHDNLNPPSISQFHSQNPKTIHHDLNLSFPGMQNFQGFPQFLDLGKVENSQRNHSSNQPSSSFSTLELLKTGIASGSSREMNSYISTPVSDLNGLYSSGFQFHHEMKPSLHFSLEGLGSRYDQSSNNVVQENVGKVLFPFGGIMKQQHPSTTTNDQVDHDNDDHDQSIKGQGNSSTGYWNGMLGGGSW